MDDTALAALLTALLAGIGGLLVPWLIARLPEPTPSDEPVEPDQPAEPDQTAEPDQPAEPAKMLYADLAARPGLGWRSALSAALAGGLLGWVTGPDWSLLWLVPLVPVGVALSVVDWHTKLLPRVVVVPATLAAIVLVVVVGLAAGDRDALVRSLVGMVGARSLFWVLWFVRSAGMGFGDVRLAALIGLVLGWAGWDELALGIWSSFVLFAVPALVVVVARRDRTLLKRSFPFGPFMVLGALVGLVWGTALGWPLAG